ncbi:hypothetical protein [Tistrella mobilis]
MIRFQHKLAFALVINLVGAVACILLFDAWDRGFIDDMRGLYQLQNTFGLPDYLNIFDQNYLRVFQYIVGMAIFFGLLFSGLIKEKHALFYLLWPNTPFLLTKLKIEFMYFPMCQIRSDLSPRKEGLLIIAILATALITSENNFMLLVFFRVVLLISRYLSLRNTIIACALSIAASILLDRNIDMLYEPFPLLYAYNYTRNIQNPEYTIFETFAILYASLNFAVVIQTDWPIHMVFSTIIFFLLLPRIGEFLRDKRLYAALTTILFFTSLTHAFQDGRYYYFILPLIADYIDRTKTLWTVCALHFITISFLYA